MRLNRSAALLLLAAASLPVDAFVPSTSKHESISSASSTTITDLTQLGTLTVPQIGCGTIAWSTEKGRPNPDLAELVTTACKQGGGFFDTGERYGSHAKTALGMGWGETECLVEQLIREADMNIDSNISAASKPVVATKFTPSPWRTTVDSVIEACDESRKRLGVDSIELYQIQMPDIVKPLRFLGIDKSYDEVYWDGLAECYHRGLVKNIGVSNYGPTLVTECHEHLAKRGVPLASNQIAYSLIGRHNGAQETLDRCNELGVKVLAYYPFAMGLLTGKYSSTSPELSAEDALTSALSLSNSKRSKFERKDLERYANGDGKRIPAGGVAPLLRTMEIIAMNRSTSVAQVALNYIICKGAIPIPGARTSAQYVDNMGALHWRLTEEEIIQMENEADNLGFSFDGAGFKRSDAKFVGYGMEKWSLS
mmetsp:Transcript_29637/g.62845  ORF Transcript_29637/g.62845 Transcript_29637/m.62845 type:complete len:424 (+) Transcript_29637:169-1440(+)